MSIIPHGFNRSVQFYLSGPSPCPYIPNQVERKLFTKLSGKKVADYAVNSLLTREGFRRSHDIVYRPACKNCTACVPVRVPVERFSPSRSLKRVANANKDLFAVRVPAAATDEMFALFSDYQKRRHADSEMSQMTREDFDAMLSEGAADTRVFQLRTEGEGNELRGAVIADRLSDGYSAVYSFFSPMEKRKSLGTQLVLTLIDQAVSEGLPFVYLGYWIKSSRKMSYKTRFRPLQRLGINGWEDFCREEEI